MNQTESGAITFFTSDIISSVPHVVHAVSSRVGGVSAAPFDGLNLGFNVGDDVSAVAENRRTFAGAVGFDLDRTVTTLQVHGPVVRVVGVDDVGTGARCAPPDEWSCDGLVTSDADVFLMGFSADCPLVMLADPPSGVVALTHAGWRSAFAGILPKTVGTMVALGADPAGTLGFVAPAIGACCYEVGPELREKAPGVTDVDSFFVPTGQGKFKLDLPGMCGQMLVDAGLDAEKIEVADLCTRCNEGLLFSYRGSGGEIGRHAAIIGRAK